MKQKSNRNYKEKLQFLQFNNLLVILILVLIIQKTNSAAYITFTTENQYDYPDCPAGSWFNSNSPYDCYNYCHFDGTDPTSTPANNHGILMWDETYTAKTTINDIPASNVSAYGIKVTINLLRYIPNSGINWGLSDNLEIFINNVSINTYDMQTYDRSFQCYDEASWATLLYVVYELDVTFTFDMTQLPIFTRNDVEIKVVPNLTNSPMYYGVSGLIVQYLQCDSSCWDCSGSLPTQCESCDVGYYLQGTKCQATNCDVGYYYDANRICYLCNVSNCDRCDSSDNTQCITCAAGYVVQTDGSCSNTGTCNSGEWLNGATCQPCDPSCVECNGGTSNDCTACIDSEYPNPATGGPCVICPTECLTCTSATTCQSCDDNYYLNPNSSTCGNAASCPAGTYPNSGSNLCAACNTGCVTCVNSSTVGCGSCQNGYYLLAKSADTSKWVCTQNCPSGQWENPGTVTCVDCDTNCKTCDNSQTDCITCKTNYYLTGTSPNRSCVACDSRCKGCYASGNTACTSCATTAYKIVGTDTCVTTCPAGYYASISTNTCQLCDVSCSQCTGPYQTGCTNGFCNDGFYYYTVGSECSTCDYKCSLCYGGYDTQCTECNNNYFLNVLNTGNTCLITCPAGQWGNTLTNECEACVSPCVTCTGGTQTDCTSCNTGDYLSGTACVGCSTADHCLTCKTSPSTCTSCTSGYYLYQNTCSATCPSHYYADGPSRTCKACSSSCLTCSGPTSSECVTCQAPRFLDGTQCKVCSDYTGYYADPQDSLTCLEYCGDGIMPSNDFECDDGNNKNGDGCSKYCTIEDGYTCMNSSKYSATVCQLNQGTFQTNFENGVKIFTNNEYNQQVNIVLTLNQELTYTSGKSIKDYLIVELEGVDDLEYEIISASHSDQSISISLTIPEAKINKEIKIYFQNDSNFVTVMTDTESKTLKSTLNLEYYAYYTDSQRSIAGALSKIYKYLLFLFMCFFFVLVFTNYFPLVHLTLDLLQLLNLYRWTQIKWPLNGHQFYNYNDHVFDWYLPSIFKEVFKNDNTDFDNYATYFEYDRDSYFWNNADQTLFASLVALVIFGIFKFFVNENIWRFKDKRRRKIQRFFKHYFTIFFQHSFYVNVTQSAMIPIFFYSMFQFSKMAGNFIGVFAIICSLASLAWTLITLVYWVLLTIKNRKELIYDDPEQDLILKINNKLFKIRILWNYLNVFLKQAYLQPVLMYIRKFLFPLLLICFNQYLDVAILPLILIYNLVYIGYFIVYQPLQEKIQNYRQIISEILHLLSYIPLMFLAFNDSSDFAKQITYSRFYIIVAIVFLAFNDAFLAYHFIISPIYKKIKSSVPKIENLYQAQDLRAETPLSTQKPKKRKEMSNLALNDELESLRDSQTKLQTPQILQESAGGFDVARRKIMRQRHKINNANIKNSRTQKNLPTTLINESTRVTSRKK